MKISENEVVIRIKPDYGITVDSEENGIVSHKVISAESLMNALEKSVAHDFKCKSGILPKNCVHFSIMQDKRYIVIEHMERYTDMYYYKTEYKCFPLPRLLYGFTLNNNNKIISVNLGVVEDKVKLTEDTKMYHYPFSNVSGFRMCTGANAIPPIKNLSALVNIPYYLFSLPDNDDHYNSSHNKFGYSHRELLEHLADKTPEYYYSDVLIKSGQTLKIFL